MAFDPAKVPGGDVGEWGRKCQASALDALAEGDWRGVYEWTKSWVGWGGGARRVDVWLLYASSGLLKGEPRSAIHTLDLGLRNWIESPIDRAVLTWSRGALVWKRLNDPKTALADLATGAAQVPTWLEPDPSSRLQVCDEAASSSRKRVPSVKPCADYSPLPSRDFVAPPVGVVVDGARPEFWNDLASYYSTL